VIEEIKLDNEKHAGRLGLDDDRQGKYVFNYEITSFEVKN